MVIVLVVVVIGQFLRVRGSANGLFGVGALLVCPSKTLLSSIYNASTLNIRRLRGLPPLHARFALVLVAAWNALILGHKDNAAGQ